jgi:hypothetical protein
MADDQKFNIEIGTKADTAGLKAAEVALHRLEAQAEQTSAAMGQVAATAGSGGGGAGGAGGGGGGGGGGPRKGAAAAVKELAEEAPKAASGARALGSAAAQVGFQVQDFAVQVGAGTSAATAFAQQGSQLLGIFGPAGALAGALLAIGAVAFNAFQATKDGGEEGAEAADALKSALEEATKEAAKLNDEFGQAAGETFIATLEREAGSYRKINEEVGRNIELMQARRRAQAEVESEQAALDLLRIDQSDMSDEDKIRARGQVQEGIEVRRMADRLAEIGDRVAKSQGEADTKQGAAAAADKALADANAELERARRERDALKERDSPERKASLESAQQELDRLLARDRELGREIDGYLSLGKEPPKELMDQFGEIGRRGAGPTPDLDHACSRLEGKVCCGPRPQRLDGRVVVAAHHGVDDGADEGRLDARAADSLDAAGAQ